MTVRAYLWEDGHAAAIAHTLRTQGFDAEVRRHRFAGEDDDEDHPFVVVTDAPTVMLELLWRSTTAGSTSPRTRRLAAPLDLPRGHAG